MYCVDCFLFNLACYERADRYFKRADLFLLSGREFVVKRWDFFSLLKRADFSYSNELICW